MQRASNFFAGRKHVWGNEPPNTNDPSSWADWLFEEADALRQQSRRRSTYSSPSSCTNPRHPAPPPDDFTARDASALIPFLSLHAEATFAEVGLLCRGRLPLNLALNCTLRSAISLCPDLQHTVDASQLCSSIIQAGLVKCPVSFICAEPRLWHFHSVTHVLLHNRGPGAVDAAACRSIATRLAASPSFQVLVTTSPLPFQHHLVYIGDANLDLDPPSSCTSDEPSPPPAPAAASAASPSKDHPENATPHRHSSDTHSDSPHTIRAAMNGSQGLRNRLASTQGNRTVHIYSTSFSTVPAGTLASLYCRGGICCLPGNAFHAGPRQEGRRVAGAGRSCLELPPLAVHTASYQDLCAGAEV